MTESSSIEHRALQAEGQSGADILQCELCFRYFRGAVLVDTKAVLALRAFPELARCGLPGCEELAAAIREEERAREWRGQLAAGRRRLSLRAERAKVKKGKCAAREESAGGAAAPRAVWSSCPEDTEALADGQWPAASVVDAPAHAVQVREFAGSSNARAQNELMLQLLRAGFDEAHPEVPGPWVANSVFQAAGIGRPNCRASDLRGTELNEPHAFVQFYDLDVDCARIANPTGNGKEHYAYRLCKRAVSERLKRERERSAAGQTELGVHEE